LLPVIAASAFQRFVVLLSDLTPGLPIFGTGSLLNEKGSLLAWDFGFDIPKKHRYLESSDE